MIPWTTEETFLLVSLWPTASATQISRWLNRSRSSICAKAMRLRHDDLLPDGVEKHFEVKPVQTRPGRARKTVTSVMPQKPAPPPLDGTVPLPDMRRCALVELDETRCRWPLGEVHEVATEFCGAGKVPALPYCAHHLRIAHGQGSAS
jgi:GcrA cell cycle regulator